MTAYSLRSKREHAKNSTLAALTVDGHQVIDFCLEGDFDDRG